MDLGHKGDKDPFLSDKDKGRTGRTDRDNSTHPNGLFRVGGVIPFDGQSDCVSDTHIGGRLALFAD